MKVYTEAVQFKADPKLTEFVDRKLTKVEQFFDKVIEARVTLKLENAGQIRDKVAEVRIQVPGEVLFASATHKTFEAAVDAVVQSLKRQVKKYKDKRRKRA